MKKLSDLTACVVDHGRFVHVARTLGQSFGKVYYTTPEERDMPVLREAAVGDGFDEIERIKSPWEVLYDCDLYVFPDIGFEEEYRLVRDAGVPAWGPGDASQLESNKGTFLMELAEAGLPVPQHEVINGLTNLRLFLKDKEDKYVKVSKYRGDLETFHWTNWEEMEGVLDSYSVRFGPLKETLAFYVLDPIEAEVEDGVDSWCVGGRFPQTILHGMECKDKAFIGTMQRFADLPDEVRTVSEEFGPVLAEYCPGAMKFSTEVRITPEGDAYFIDPTCRFGSPPSQGECLLIRNLADVIWRGANGELAEPEFEDRFVAQAMVNLCDLRDEWRSVRLEPELDERLKCGHCCRLNDCLVLTPIEEYPTHEVGYLVATGKTIRAAIESLGELKDQLPDGLKCDYASLADILKEIHEAEASGMPFTNAIVPEPEEIVARG